MNSYIALFKKFGVVRIRNAIPDFDIRRINSVVERLKLTHDKFSYNKNLQFYNTDIEESHNVKYFYHKYVITNTLNILNFEKAIRNIDSHILWKESAINNYKNYPHYNSKGKFISCFLTDSPINFGAIIQRQESLKSLKPGEMLFVDSNIDLNLYYAHNANLVYFSFQIKDV